MSKANHAILMEDIRAMVTDLRVSDPTASSLRKWADKLLAASGYVTPYRTIKRREQENEYLDVGYVLACAIAADVEIVLGREPRIIGAGLEDHARDFARLMRREVPAAPESRAVELKGLLAELDRKLFKRLPQAV